MTNVTRPTRERVDELVQWHGFDGCERLITELPPEDQSRQNCELALEVLALRAELHEIYNWFIEQYMQLLEKDLNT